MRKRLIASLILLSMLCTSCGQIETQSEVADTLQTESQEISVTIGESESTTMMEETSVETEETVSSVNEVEKDFDITLENVFDIMEVSENREGMRWYLTSEHRFFNIRYGLEVDDIQIIRSYFGEYDYQPCEFEYTGEAVDVSFLLMLDFLYPYDNENGDYYSIRIYNEYVENQLILEIYSSANDGSLNYVANVDNLQDVFDDYIQLMVDNGY